MENFSFALLDHSAPMLQFLIILTQPYKVFVDLLTIQSLESHIVIKAM